MYVLLSNVGYNGNEEITFCTCCTDKFAYMTIYIYILQGKKYQVEKKKGIEQIQYGTGREHREGFVGEEGEEALEPCLRRREERVPPLPGYRAEEKQMLALKMMTGSWSCEQKQRNEEQGRRKREGERRRMWLGQRS